jgi:hypothetical protein
VVSGDGDSAFLGKLVGVAHEVQHCLPQPHLVSMHCSGRSVAGSLDD